MQLILKIALINNNMMLQLEFLEAFMQELTQHTFKVAIAI